MITLLIADIIFVIVLVLSFVCLIVYLLGYGVAGIGNKIQNKIWKAKEKPENESEVENK